MRDFSVIAIFERKFFYMSEEIEIKDEVLDLKVTETYDENQIQVLIHILTIIFRDVV